MKNVNIFDELRQFGPQANAPAPTLAEAEAYCSDLARRRQENFTVVSFLLPRALRSHFYNIYAYCRWADDLSDEIGDPAKSLELLQWWNDSLVDCFAGKASHPVFVALHETVRQFQIPIEPFADLLSAFRQDQTQTRYETLDELLGYCRRSADPVGRLILYLGRCFSAENARLSDSICTGLQLVNFWQDVADDRRRGRIYVPQEDCRRFGVAESDFAAGKCTDAFRSLLKYECDVAERYLLAGRPLVEIVPNKLRLDIELFIEGGLGTVHAIRRANYDVWTARPHLSKMNKSFIAVRCWLMSHLKS